MVIIPREVGFGDSFALAGVEVKNFNFNDKIGKMMGAAVDVAKNSAANSARNKTKPLKTGDAGINELIDNLRQIATGVNFNQNLGLIGLVVVDLGKVEIFAGIVFGAVGRNGSGSGSGWRV